MAAVNSSPETACIGSSGKEEIMLFGVRVVVDPMRKCVSLNNLSDYEESPPPEEDIPKIAVAGDKIIAAGYSSANDAVQISSSCGGNRRRGVPWTEKEHKMFLIGLEKLGKGDWKGISRNFVKSRTPTQVASHAQKHFLRRTNLSCRRRRRRYSLFDITTETVTRMAMEQDHQVDHAQDNTYSSLHETDISSEHQQAMYVSPRVVSPTRSENADAACPDPLSLSLSLASSYNHNELSKSRHSTFAMMPSFSDGDSNSSSIIRVA